MRNQAKSNFDYVAQRFLDAGYSPAQTAAVLGNFKQEAGRDLMPHTEEISGGGGYGIAQWTGPRRQALYNFAGDRANTIEGQVDFVLHELNTTEKRARDSLMAAQSVDDATIAFRRDFERAGIPHDKRRLAYAQESYQRLNGLSPGATADATPSAPASKPEATDGFSLGSVAAAGLGGFAGGANFESNLKRLAKGFEDSQEEMIKRIQGGGRTSPDDVVKDAFSSLESSGAAGVAAIQALAGGGKPARSAAARPAATTSAANGPTIQPSGSGMFFSGDSGKGTGEHVDARIWDPKTGGWIDPKPYLNRFQTNGKSLADLFPITSRYGNRIHPVDGVPRHHSGIDLGVPKGTPLSVDGGEWIGTKYDEGGGGWMGGWKLPDGKEAWVLHGQKPA